MVKRSMIQSHLFWARKPSPVDGYKSPPSDYAAVRRIRRIPGSAREACQTSRVVREVLPVEKYAAGSSAIGMTYVSERVKLLETR